jgi:hypothetical protein
VRTRMVAFESSRVSTFRPTLGAALCSVPGIRVHVNTTTLEIHVVAEDSDTLHGENVGRVAVF